MKVTGEKLRQVQEEQRGSARTTGNMSRSFNSVKRSPALVCSVGAFVIVYVVYGLLLVPHNSNRGVRNFSKMRPAAVAAPTGSVPTVTVRYTQEELERVMISHEARRAVEPRDLMNRLREIGLEIINKNNSVMEKDDSVDAKPDLVSLEGVQSSGRIPEQEKSDQKEDKATPNIELDGGRLVLKGPEIEDGIIPGRPIPPECNAEPHTDYDGVAVRWGLTFSQEDAADCCQACIDQARNAQGGELRCNVWVYCGAEEGCYSPDIYEHKQFECWLKQSEQPRTNFKGRYPPAYREEHPNCTEVVAWASDKQARHGDPLVDWVEAEVGARLVVSSSIVGPSHPQDFVSSLEKCLRGWSHWQLVQYTPSAIARNKLNIEQTIEVICMEENHQVEDWGYVEGGHDIDESDIRVRIAAALVF